MYKCLIIKSRPALVVDTCSSISADTVGAVHLHSPHRDIRPPNGGRFQGQQQQKARQTGESLPRIRLSWHSSLTRAGTGSVGTHSPPRVFTQLKIRRRATPLYLEDL